MGSRDEALARGAIKLHRAGSGPPLVLLHCLGADHRLWQIAAAGLDREFTLLTGDLPGHGEAPVPSGPYVIADLSAQLGAALEREGIERAHIAGISLGGVVAQHFAATQPGRVERLTLIDTTPLRTEELSRGWRERAAAARARGVASFMGALLRLWFNDSFIAADPPAVRYARETLARCSSEGYALACEALAGADLAPLVPRIRAPTLVVCGDDDVPIFRTAARWLVDNIRGARGAWLTAARHCSVLEQPEAFRGVLRAFLHGMA
jgi:3-oxoadipate enol-lactonase